jgi:hypothetical protein
VRRPDVLRAWLIAILVVAAVLSVIGKKQDSPFIGWLSFAAFLCAIFMYFSWRRAALAERRGRAHERDDRENQ